MMCTTQAQIYLYTYTHVDSECGGGRVVGHNFCYFFPIFTVNTINCCHQHRKMKMNNNNNDDNNKKNM